MLYLLGMDSLVSAGFVTLSSDVEDLSLQECNTVLLNKWLQPLQRNARLTQGFVSNGQAYSTQQCHVPAYARRQLG